MAQALGEREWLRPKQAAEYLGVSLSTLYNWRKKGLVRFHRIGPRAVALKRDELEGVAVPDGDAAAAPRGDSAARCRALAERLHRKYGTMPDSTPLIRADREAR